MRPAGQVSEPEAGDSIDSRLADALERVGQVLRTQVRAAGAPHGLSPIQVQLLLRLATVEEKGREPARLAGWFDVARPTISDATAALRRKGLLIHEPVPGDRRRTRLILTGLGRELAGQLARWDGPVQAELATLPPAAKRDALVLLLALIGGMQRSGLIGVARTCTTCRFFGPDEQLGAAGHCNLLDVPLPPEALRLDCPDHDPAA